MRSHSVGPTITWKGHGPAYMKAVLHNATVQAQPKHGADDAIDPPHDAAKMRPYVFGGRDDD